MALVIVVYVPEGIIMASDSRRIIVQKKQNQIHKIFNDGFVFSDSVNRTLLLERQHIGISIFGTEIFQGSPVSVGLVPFISNEIADTDTVDIVSQKLYEYFHKKFLGSDLGFHVAGYKKKGKAIVPHNYYYQMEQRKISRTNINKDGSLRFGASYAGTIDVIESILNPIVYRKDGIEEIIKTPPIIPWEVMTVQDAIDFAIYAIQVTINTIRFQRRIPSVGGAIDILLLTPEAEPKWIQKKDYHGEDNSY